MSPFCTRVNECVCMVVADFVYVCVCVVLAIKWCARTNREKLFLFYSSYVMRQLMNTTIRLKIGRFFKSVTWPWIYCIFMYIKWIVQHQRYKEEANKNQFRVKRSASLFSIFFTHFISPPSNRFLCHFNTFNHMASDHTWEGSMLCSFFL